MSPNRTWWIPLTAIVIAIGYLPTVWTPFDFIDDGNLVYPAPPGTTFREHCELWLMKVVANYEHLGPVRPTLWAHWEVMANVSGGDPVIWRLFRLGFCAWSAGMFLWLLRELKVHPIAAILTTVNVMWNPYRNEIWTSLTLGEGVAMPYAILALIGAKKAEKSSRAWIWDVLAIFGLVTALGCKNTFVALIPPMIILRANWKRAIPYVFVLALPIAHYIYFKLNWHPGQYETFPPSFAQFLSIVSCLKGAMSLDFLGVGIVVIGIGVAWRAQRTGLGEHRSTILAALALLGAGIVVYMPLDRMSGRYSMPAVWGLDILFGLLLTAFVGITDSRWKWLGWGTLGAGLIAIAIANTGRQQKFNARAQSFWDALDYVEQNAPPNTTIDWVCGDSTRGELNVEEGIHFQWHINARSRTDIQIRLIETDGQPVSRVEVPETKSQPTMRMYGTTPKHEGWKDVATFSASYWFGWKKRDCHLTTR